MLRRLNKKAQSISEYAMVLAIVISAISATQLFVKRGLQGKVKDVSDRYLVEMNGSLPAALPKDATGAVIYQYEPGDVSSEFSTSRDTETESIDVNAAAQGVWARSSGTKAAPSKVSRAKNGYQKNTY